MPPGQQKEPASPTFLLLPLAGGHLHPGVSWHCQLHFCDPREPSHLPNRNGVALSWQVEQHPLPLELRPSSYLSLAYLIAPEHDSLGTAPDMQGHTDAGD